MNMTRDVKVDLTEYLRELHLPAILQMPAATSRDKHW